MILCAFVNIYLVCFVTHYKLNKSHKIQKNFSEFSPKKFLSKHNSKTTRNYKSNIAYFKDKIMTITECKNVHNTVHHMFANFKAKVHHME